MRLLAPRCPICVLVYVSGGPAVTGVEAQQGATAAEKGNAMTMIEESPELELCSGYESELQVGREDISFHDLPGDRVRISVTVRNAGTHRSVPSRMRLESAPL